MSSPRVPPFSFSPVSIWPPVVRDSVLSSGSPPDQRNPSVPFLLRRTFVRDERNTSFSVPTRHFHRLPPNSLHYFRPLCLPFHDLLTNLCPSRPESFRLFRDKVKSNSGKGVVTCHRDPISETRGSVPSTCRLSFPPLSFFLSHLFAPKLLPSATLFLLRPPPSPPRPVRTWCVPTLELFPFDLSFGLSSGLRF